MGVSGGKSRANFAGIEKQSVSQENVNSELGIIDKYASDIGEKVEEKNKLSDDSVDIEKN